jgi:hypothetical protein
MVPSAAGALVFLALLLIGRLAGGAIIIGLFASLAFGCTAIASIPALGSSSPLIYTMFVLLLIMNAVLRPNFPQALALVFRQHFSAMAASALAVWALASAIVLPRLFSGETSAFIPVNGEIREVALAPAAGNITQTAYLTAGILAFLSLRILLVQRSSLKAVRSGFFSFIIANVLLGILDLAGKVAGLGDWLLPIRTADYALLSEVEATGFWRIVGGYSEASAFAMSCLACVAFTFVYWRRSGSLLAMALTLALLFLLIFSTSSTAYVGLAFLSLLAAVPMGATFVTGKIKVQDLLLFGALLIVIACALAAYLYSAKLYDPFADLIRTMVLEKSNSSSGQERSYWNYVSLQSFLETYGLGIGMGSSRSSSWLVSVISQLGLVGTLIFAALTAAIFHGVGSIRVCGQAEIYALASSARAMAAGWLIGICVSGSGADPGLLFFLILAVILGCKAHLSAHRRAARRAATARAELMRA